MSKHDTTISDLEFSLLLARSGCRELRRGGGRGADVSGRSAAARTLLIGVSGRQ